MVRVNPDELHVPAKRLALSIRTVGKVTHHPILQIAFKMYAIRLAIHPVLNPFLQPRVIVVQALSGAAAIPVFQQRTLVKDELNAATPGEIMPFRRHHVPLANPEIELPILRCLAWKRGLQELLVFSVVVKLLELWRARNVIMNTRRQAGRG